MHKFVFDRMKDEEICDNQIVFLIITDYKKYCFNQIQLIFKFEILLI